MHLDVVLVANILLEQERLDGLAMVALEVHHVLTSLLVLEHLALASELLLPRPAIVFGAKQVAEVHVVAVGIGRRPGGSTRGRASSEAVAPAPQRKCVAWTSPCRGWTRV